MTTPIAVFAAALARAYRESGLAVRLYVDCSDKGRAFWDDKAREILPGVLAAILWR